MAVNIDQSEEDTDYLSDMPTEADNDEEQPKLTGKEANQHILAMRRKIEDRLERRRLKEELGCDDLWELEF